MRSIVFALGLVATTQAVRLLSPPPTTTEWKNIFGTLDKNGDNIVTLEEAKTAMKENLASASPTMTKSEAEDLMDFVSGIIEGTSTNGMTKADLIFATEMQQELQARLALDC